MTDLQKQLKDFLNWLKLNHPKIFEKYGRNFTTSIEGNGTVVVNDNFKISRDEFEMLCGIANSYYQP